MDILHFRPHPCWAKLRGDNTQGHHYPLNLGTLKPSVCIGDTGILSMLLHCGADANVYHHLAICIKYLLRVDRFLHHLTERLCMRQGYM